MRNFMSAALTVDDIYPVGSIYMSVNATDPARLFGGTWERIKERFLLGAGDTHTAGSTGGEFEHKLTVDEMPKHTHNTAKGAKAENENLQTMDQYQTYQSEYGITPGKYWAAHTLPTGGDKPHNTTPPLFGSVYLASHRVKFAKAGWRYE